MSMQASEIFYYTATGCSLIIVILTIYVGNRFMQTLDEIDLFLKDMRHITADVHNAPDKMKAGMLGIAANVLQFFIGRR